MFKEIKHIETVLNNHCHENAAQFLLLSLDVTFDLLYSKQFI